MKMKMKKLSKYTFEKQEVRIDKFYNDNKQSIPKELHNANAIKKKKKIEFWYNRSTILKEKINDLEEDKFNRIWKSIQKMQKKKNKK